jgi:hypothetical protein
MDHAEAANRYRNQAEEFRAKAGIMSDTAARDSYLKMADAYDAMAANEERIAGNTYFTPKAAE